MGEATQVVLPDPPHFTPALAPPEKTALYVGDLDAAVSEEDLARTLGSFGTILSTRVCRDRDSGKSLRYAYVNFNSKFSAENALQVMNHATLKGKPMRIMWTDRNASGRKNGIGNLFVKNLDESIDGLELELLFRPYGQVDSCKVELDEKGRSRGFGFVQMSTEEAAQSAIEALNGTFPTGSLKKLYVGKFVRKCERQGSKPHPESFNNLYIKNLEKDLTEEVLKEKFSEFGKITSVVVMKDENGKSRGFGFVSFESPDDAKKAMDAMNATKLGLKTIYVGPAQKKVERQDSIKKQVGEANDLQFKKTLGTTVFVRNIEDSVTDEALQEHFAPCGKIVWLKVSRDINGRSKGYCFVCFSSLEGANEAVSKLNGSKLNGKNLYVAIAQNRENRFKFYPGQQFFSAGDCPLISHPPYLAPAYQPDRLFSHIGNQGFRYLSAPSPVYPQHEQIRNYSRSANMFPFHRPACHPPFNSPMHPMMVYVPPPDSYYAQGGRYAVDDYYLNQRCFQPARYEKGTMKKTEGTSGVKKSQPATLSKFDKLDPKLRKSKIIEFLNGNMPMLEHKQATALANVMLQMSSAKVQELLAKPRCLGQLLKEVAKELGEDQVAAPTPPLLTN